MPVERQKLMDLRTSATATSCGVVTTNPQAPGISWTTLKRLIPGTGWRVDDEVVQFSPVDLLDELPDGGHLERPSPYNRVVLFSQEETDGDDLEVLAHTYGMDAVFVAPHPFAPQAEDDRDAGAVEVDVHQAYPEPPVGQTQGQAGGDRALAHAPLAAQHHYLVLDVQRIRLHERVRCPPDNHCCNSTSLSAILSPLKRAYC